MITIKVMPATVIPSLLVPSTLRSPTETVIYLPIDKTGHQLSATLIGGTH